MWWIKGFIKREKVPTAAMLPPSLAMRREIEKLAGDAGEAALGEGGPRPRRGPQHPDPALDPDPGRAAGAAAAGGLGRGGRGAWRAARTPAPAPPSATAPARPVRSPRRPWWRRTPPRLSPQPDRPDDLCPRRPGWTARGPPGGSCGSAPRGAAPREPRRGACRLSGHGEVGGSLAGHAEGDRGQDLEALERDRRRAVHAGPVAARGPSGRARPRSRPGRSGRPGAACR